MFQQILAQIFLAHGGQILMTILNSQQKKKKKQPDPKLKDKVKTLNKQ